MDATIAPIVKDTPESLEDVIRWIAAHDARNETLWEKQHEWVKKHDESDLRAHKEMEGKLSSHSARITSLERRVAWITGAAAVIGAATGSVISQVLA